MAGFLARAMSLHHAALAQAGGVVIKYRRGGHDVQLTAVPARGLSEDLGEQTAVVAALRDWILDGSKLVLDGQTVTPQLRDEITCDGRTYVVAFRDGENCWRSIDAYSSYIRVHSTERASE